MSYPPTVPPPHHTTAPPPTTAVTGTDVPVPAAAATMLGLTLLAAALFRLANRRARG